MIGRAGRKGIDTEGKLYLYHGGVGLMDLTIIKEDSQPNPLLYFSL